LFVLSSFPTPSEILLVTYDHYQSQYKVREVHRRLKNMGHRLYILRTNTGLFLDYLREQDSFMKREVFESNNTNKVFEWKK